MAPSLEYHNALDKVIPLWMKVQDARILDTKKYWNVIASMKELPNVS